MSGRVLTHPYHDLAVTALPAAIRSFMRKLFPLTEIHSNQSLLQQKRRKHRRPQHKDAPSSNGQANHCQKHHMLLQFCFRLQLTLYDFLFQEIDTLRPYLGDPESLPLIFPKKKPLIQVEKVYQALERIVADNEQPPPSLRTIGRRIGYTSQVLSRCHPPACREIVQRYNTYVQQRKEARLQRVQEEIQQAVLQLRSQGLPLSQKRISPLLSQPGVLRNPQVCAFLREILAG